MALNDDGGVDRLRARMLTGVNERTTAQSGSTISQQLDDVPSNSSRASQIAPKRVANVRDLDAVMNNASHFSFREGVTMSDQERPQARAAILFEAVKSMSGLIEVIYLPLVASAPPRFRPVHPVTQGTHSPDYNDRSREDETSRRVLQNNPRLRVLPDRAGEDETARRVIQNNPRLRVLPATEHSIAHRTSQTGPTSLRWPSRDVPVEIFAMITQTLTYRDIRNMRLVCKDFDRKTSPVLFKEVIVPFTAELYDMVENDVTARLSSLSVRQGKGKAKASSPSLPSGGPASEDSIYYRTSTETAPRHGLRVFQSFGPHMTKFGIRFEVTETDLIAAPDKQIHFNHVEAYHGDYAWPPGGYSRFGRLANLERIADETPRMTAALATLVNVREIGLSLESGLGFLSGPDRSPHDMIFDRPSPIFEGANMEQRSRSDGLDDFWSCLRESHGSFTAHDSIARERLLTCVLDSDSTGNFSLAPASRFEDTSRWPSAKIGGILAGSSNKLTNEPLRGIFYTTCEEVVSTESPPSPPLSPGRLTSQQKQWLLETGWAQSAFLDTYILALADNPNIFHQVTKVSISKISSGLLKKLNCKNFWDTLPNAEDVTLLVSPDWRTVGKDGAGCAEITAIRPSMAAEMLHFVLSRLLHLRALKKLRIGYTEGGERGKGMFGRNSNLMPAPIALTEELLKPAPDVVAVDHIEDLTLVNCWVTPRALMRIINTETLASVPNRLLTLETVSLTANTQPERQDIEIFAGNTVQTFRESCWPALIKTFEKSPYSRISLKSCGYALLPGLTSRFDQTALDLGPAANMARPGPIHTDSEWFRRRFILWQHHMMGTTDSYLGRVLPWMGAQETSVLVGAWGMSLVSEDGQVAECDGMPRTGTGRFTGVLNVD